MANGPPIEKAPEKRDDATPAVSRCLPDGTVIELLYRPEERVTAFAMWREGQWTIEQQIALGPERLVPFSPRNNLIKNEVVLLPSGVEEYGTQVQLISDLRAFIRRYADLSSKFETVATYYVLLTWIYDAFNDLPYLRLRGDFGTGKTRTLLTIGSVCYKAFFASGASTVSPIFHTLDAFAGTLIFDEADFRFSDERADMVKILNNGNVRGMPVLRTMMNSQREFNPRAFQVFGPKIAATRGSYEDKGLESRFLTEEMGARRLRTDVPINLPSSFTEEARTLRNKLLLYRFRNRMKVRLDESLIDAELEPRLNQILLPLLSVVADENDRAELRALGLEAQANVAAERGLAVEAHVLESLLRVMAVSERTAVPVGEVAAVMIRRYGRDYDRPITSRWIGRILRERLGLRTYKSHGNYVVPKVERTRLDLLCTRYGVAIEDVSNSFELPGQDGSVDVGSSGTSKGPSDDDAKAQSPSVPY